MHRRKNNKFYQSTSGVTSACGEETIFPAALKYQRTEYAKKIRKDYEAGKIKERRCNMREYVLRTDGVCNTITTVTKDNYIAVGAAMRGRYNPNGKIEQKIETRNDEIANAITTVQKDSLVIENFTNPQADKILPVGKL